MYHEVSKSSILDILFYCPFKIISLQKRGDEILEIKEIENARL